MPPIMHLVKEIERSFSFFGINAASSIDNLKNGARSFL